jgi:dienelactone hydrolase
MALQSNLILRNPFFPLLALGAAAAFPATMRVEKTIDRDWTFQYFPASEPDLRTIQPGYDDSRWQAIALPHTWSTYETTGDVHPFIRSATEREDTYWWYGWGWYRKWLVIGKQYQDRLIALEFDGVQKYSRVWVNGAPAGEHKGGYTSFSVDITKLVRFGEPNVIAVQVSNRRDDEYRIPPMTAGNFDVYGGIYRDVRLVICDRLHVPFQGSAQHEGGTFVTTPEVSEERATVQVRTWVRNDYPAARTCELITTIRDAAGATVAHSSSRETIAPGETKQFEQRFGPIAKPHLWSPDTPYLYKVATEVRDGARMADTYSSPLGFRWYKWNYDENRLYLNGRKVLLRGINRHQEYPWLGDAMPKWMHKQDLEDIRYGMGLNFQRTVHYPNDPYVYDQCDRMGFILIEELPNIKDITFDKGVQRTMLQEAIRRDRNHPSIFIWSIGNETNQPADSAWAREEDQSRIIYLRRGDNGGKFVQLTDKNLAIENLLRCTIRGWYSSDDRDFGPQTRNPSSGQVTGTEEWQHETDRRSEKLADDNVVVWLYADHGADRKYLNSPLLYVNPKGWKDAYRFPKFAYYLWQANFTTKPMAFILPTWWREQYVGQRKPITVDSNAAEVTLRVNGRAIGSAKPSAANNHSVTFDNVLIERGTISVDGLSSLTMAGKPARLVMKTPARQIPADHSGIAVLSVDIVDAAGVHVFGANPPLTWTVSGPATLAAPATFQSDTAKNGALEGTLYIDAPVANVLRSSATPGSIKVRVTAPGLEPAEVTLESVAPSDDRVEGIAEPSVAGAGRIHVSRDASFKPVVLAAKSSRKSSIAELKDDANFKGPDYRAQIEAFVKERNPGLDVFSTGYRAFIERLVQIAAERNGRLIADDYNFNAHAFNEGKQPKPNKTPKSAKPKPEPEGGDAKAAIKSTLFVPDPLPAASPEQYGRFEPAPGVVAERVSYATAYGLRVPAIVYRPAHAPAAKLPAFIVVNGHGGDKYSWYSFYGGILYARAGAVVLTYDPIGEGERNAQRKDGTRQHDRNVDPPEMARRMAGLMITDIMQSVSYLASRPDVDARRIGAGGYSMGSFILSLACAVETRLNACVLVGGGNLDGAGGYWETSSKKMCQGIPYQSLAFLGDRAAAIYNLHAARGATLVWNGDADEVVSIPKMGAPFFEDLRRRTIALHGNEKNVFEFGFTPGGSHRPYFLTKPVALWLHEHLEFPNWTKEAIEKMPETHILEWAPAHNVTMDKMYFTESREGGTRALGAEIPAVPHDELNALPSDRWERDKDRYIYEGWLKAAKESLQ